MPCLYSLHPVQVSHCLLKSLCVPLWSCFQGLLSRLSDFLLCRWSCRSCWQWCWECSCCQPTDEEVEILGPFPAQTPSWLWVHTHTTLIQPTNNAHTSQITQSNSSFISSVYSLIITVRLKLRQTESEYTVLLNNLKQSQRYHLSKAHCWWWMVCSGHVWNGILASRLLNTSQYEQHIYLLFCITIHYTIHRIRVGNMLNLLCSLHLIGLKCTIA